MSDVQATTQDLGAATGVTTEDAFQQFFDNGGLDESRRPEDDPNAQSENTQAQAGDDHDAAQAGQDEHEEHESQADEREHADKPKYNTIAELLAAHKVDPNVDWQSLPVTVKIDGKESQVPLADVLESYQLKGHVNNKSIEVSNLKHQVEQERQQFQQAAQQEIQRHQAMGNLAMQMLNHDYQKVDWNTLRFSNPAEYAALQADFANRQTQIGQFMQNVQAMQAQEQERQQGALRQSMTAEQDKLMNARPEWRNEDAFRKDRDQMQQYARTLGFQDAELSSIYDHRYMLILHDAARYRALQAASPEAVRQVRNAPAVAKPGSRVDSNPNVAKRQAVLERFKRNPGDVDAQAAAFDFFAQ